MIRFAILFSLLAAPLAAQTAINDRPGRWLSVAQPQGAVSEAPAVAAPVVEAPVVEALGPEVPSLEVPSLGEAASDIPASDLLIVTTPEAPALLPAPDPNQDIAILEEPQPAAPLTRPIPRPFEPVVADAQIPAVEAPALETPRAAAPVQEVAAVAPEPSLEPALDTALDPAPELEPVVPAPVAALPGPVTAPVPAPGPAPEPQLEVAALPDPTPDPTPGPAPVPVPAATVVEGAPPVQPPQRPQTEATAAMAEALAEQIAAAAQAIVVTGPRDVPRVSAIAEADALAPVRVATIPDLTPVAPVPVPVPVAEPDPAPEPEADVAPEAAPARLLSPPDVVPTLASGFARSEGAAEPVRLSAVLLPAQATSIRPLVQPAAFAMPPLESAPILPRLRPWGPDAVQAVVGLTPLRTAPLSAVLLPSVAARPTPVPLFARAPAPAYDPFPLSALPPSALPEGPVSQMRAIQPPRPFAEANAAVLTGMPTVILARMPVPQPSEPPMADTPVSDPDAPTALPEPDANALARMMEDAAICWRLADLSVEAQWARVSVDVALDETNMPSAQSIRLTGFARVVSGAAENAYRAAHSALLACAEATSAEPVTTTATLVFDRTGVRLR